MGAETVFSPPPPPLLEPTLSPETDISGHDNRSLRADMMSALGESVSFGRFLSEPLEWGKWSAFEHKRYLEEAARQARPGSVAQKKALFEARYAKRRKGAQEEDEERAGGGVELDGATGAGGTDASSSSATESSCMTDEPPVEEEEACGGGDVDVAECGGGVADGPVGVPDEVEAIADGVGEAASELCHREGDEEKDGLCDDNLVKVDAVKNHPLKEISVVNQDITDSVKKRTFHMSSLLQKPAKSSSPSSGKKGQSSSVKRRSLLHSAKENTSPLSKQDAASVPKKMSTLVALHMSMSFMSCETANTAPASRNNGTTIAERISQLESASRPMENTRREEFMPPRKIFSRASPEAAPVTAQVDEHRSSHVLRVKEKLFGSASSSVHQKTSITKEKERKFNNEPGIESRQSFCFKARPLPSFYRRNKQTKDSTQRTAQEIPNLPNSDHLLSDVSDTHEMSKGVPKQKQICCFPIRKMH